MVDADGNVFLFGGNHYGQIGTGSKKNKKVRQPFKIPTLKCHQLAIGDHHTLMLSLQNGNEVYACGLNSHNQCFQMQGERNVLSPALCTREAMGIGYQERYGNVVRVIAGYSNSIIVVEKM